MVLEGCISLTNHLVVTTGLDPGNSNFNSTQQYIKIIGPLVDRVDVRQLVIEERDIVFTISTHAETQAVGEIGP